METIELRSITEIQTRIAELEVQFKEVSDNTEAAFVAVATRIMNQIDSLKWVLNIQ